MAAKINILIRSSNVINERLTKYNFLIHFVNIIDLFKDNGWRII
jgi:hypothetical protein